MPEILIDLRNTSPGRLIRDLTGCGWLSIRAFMATWRAIRTRTMNPGCALTKKEDWLSVDDSLFVSPPVIALVPSWSIVIGGDKLPHSCPKQGG